jgi:dihydroorotate dehydrogenase electron transfer subunit
MEKPDANIRQVSAPITGQVQVAPDHYLMEISAQDLAHTARPGQFVMVRVGQGLDPLLRRPFSIHAVKDGALLLVYRVVGKGTRLLTGLVKGDHLDVVGPLGKGFSLPSQAEDVIMAAGGIGIAPLLFLAQIIGQTSPRSRMALYYGARTRAELIRLEPFRELGVSLHLATEDGSLGTRGLVTDLLATLAPGAPPGPVFCCGPEEMLKAVARLPAMRERKVQFCLEAKMACGMGACLGCAQETRHGYAHVCVDGPVFDLEELSWGP